MKSIAFDFRHGHDMMRMTGIEKGAGLLSLRHFMGVARGVALSCLPGGDGSSQLLQVLEVSALSWTICWIMFWIQIIRLESQSISVR